jgi:hypothetical protein
MSERIDHAEDVVKRTQDVYREFFSDGLARDGFARKLRSALFEALYGKPRSESVWLNEISPEQHRAESPHHSCGREEGHDGHAWRGSLREFGGVDVTRTYWCEGVK